MIIAHHIQWWPAEVWVAICAVAVAVVTMIKTTTRMESQTRMQQEHNYMTVKPLAWISLGDFEDTIRITLQNHGVGPMIILDVQVTDGVENKSDVISWMPNLPPGIAWAMFVSELKDRVLKQDGELVLLELNGNSNDYHFIQFRNKVRAKLKTLELSVHYSDLYQRKMPPCIRHMKWFGR